MEAEIRDQFMREQGMDQKTATQWAKMMVTAAPVMQKHMVDNVTQTLSPLVQTVGSMQADRIFQQSQDAKSDPYGLLQMPEIYDQVHQGLQLMVQNGQPVSVGAVQSLANMAYGELALTKPEVIAQYQQQPPTSQPVFGNNANIRGSSRGLPSPSGGAIRPRLNGQPQNNGAPVAQDAETGKAVAATVAAMLRGTNIKINQIDSGERIICILIISICITGLITFISGPARRGRRPLVAERSCGSNQRRFRPVPPRQFDSNAVL